MVAKCLALMNIRDVNLNNRALQRADTVVQGYGSVGVGTGIEHDTVTTETNLLHLVNQLTLDIALVIGYLDIRIAGLKLRQILVKRRRTVNAWFPGTQEIQIRTIDDLDFHISRKFIIFAGKINK